jgi:phosphatidylserine decarboxylase
MSLSLYCKPTSTDRLLQVPDFQALLFLIDDVIVKPPRIESIIIDGEVVTEVVVAFIGLFFDLLSNTSAGYDLFRKPVFNTAMKDLIDAWGTYLADPNGDSNSSLTDKEYGWFSELVLQALESDGRGTFNQTYVCPDPDAVNRGYATFDAFFARDVQPDARPVLAPNDKSLIHSACESYVYRIATKVKEHDRFWLKGQSYSLYDMLDRDEESANKFTGGTVYQAFLSPLDYHRWNAPVDGVIVETTIIPGTYYAVLPDDGADENDPDQDPGSRYGAIVRSQSWLTMSSTRALIFIEADNPDIGLMCFIAVGMWEVSSCEITVSEGDHVMAGDGLGTFHIGGSTHALIFGPGTAITFADNIKPENHVLVKSVIAKATKKPT